MALLKKSRVGGTLGSFRNFAAAISAEACLIPTPDTQAGSFSPILRDYQRGSGYAV